LLEVRHLSWQLSSQLSELWRDDFNDAWARGTASARAARYVRSIQIVLFAVAIDTSGTVPMVDGGMSMLRVRWFL
jgi:hypothetical protein